MFLDLKWVALQELNQVIHAFETSSLTGFIFSEPSDNFGLNQFSIIARLQDVRELSDQLIVSNA